MTGKRWIQCIISDPVFMCQVPVSVCFWKTYLFILFIYLGFYVAFNTVKVIYKCIYVCMYIMTGSWKGRGNQYIEFARVVYCKLPTNGKQLPAFPLKAVTGIKPRPQRWEARVLPLCHRGPLVFGRHQMTKILTAQEFH